MTSQAKFLSDFLPLQDNFIMENLRRIEVPSSKVDIKHEHTRSFTANNITAFPRSTLLNAEPPSPQVSYMFFFYFFGYS